jgi:hypothetical protein
MTSSSAATALGRYLRRDGLERFGVHLLPLRVGDELGERRDDLLILDVGVGEELVAHRDEGAVHGLQSVFVERGDGGTGGLRATTSIAKEHV